MRPGIVAYHTIQVFQLCRYMPLLRGHSYIGQMLRDALQRMQSNVYHQFSYRSPQMRVAYLQVRLEASAACLPAGVPHESWIAVAEVARSPLDTLLQ